MEEKKKPESLNLNAQDNGQQEEPLLGKVEKAIFEFGSMDNQEFLNGLKDIVDEAEKKDQEKKEQA